MWKYLDSLDSLYWSKNAMFCVVFALVSNLLGLGPGPVDLYRRYCESRTYKIGLTNLKPIHPKAVLDTWAGLI